VEYVTPEQLSAVSAADLDDDGDLDLVSAHSTELALWMNMGDGRFGEPSFVMVPRSTRFVTTADLTGDGLPDLVTANTRDDVVGTLVNLGGATFGGQTTYVAGQRPEQVVAVDLELDGDLDLVVLDTGEDMLIPFLNNAGRFTAGSPFATELSIQEIVAGDLDSDGYYDLVVRLPFEVAVLEGLEDRAFTAPRRLDASLRSLDLVDLDGDGDLDLGGAHTTNRSVEFFGNPGDGRFQRLKGFSIDARDVSAGDFDGDGDVDLALTNEAPDRIDVLWNGEVGAVTLDRASYGTSGRTHGLDVGDFDGDGDVDVAAVNGPERSLDILFNRGDGTFSAPVVYLDVVGDHANDVVSVDVDGDEDIDLVVVSRGDGALLVLFNQGDGVFSDFTLYETGGAFYAVAPDMDGDGDFDLVSANPGTDTLSILYNVGTGVFEGRTDLPVEAGPSGVATGDVDGDGMVDLVSANLAASTVSVVRGLGNRSFASPESLPVIDNPGFVTLADIDADLDLDVVTANRGGSFDPRVNSTDGGLGVFKNRGDGTFESQTTIPLVFNPWSVTATDLDGDGRMDLVSPSQQESKLSVLLGGGDGSFADPVIYNVTNSPRFVFAADLNGDGSTDLTSNDRLSNSITVLLNRATTSLFEGDFLETICTDLDFHNVSAATVTPGATQRSGAYLMPARDAPELLTTVFPNVAGFPLMPEFLAEVFPERFPGLSPDAFAALVDRRESRDYYTGSLRRLRLPEDEPDGGGVVFGFDVRTDAADTTELLSLDEVGAVLERLRLSFQLEPLVYAPKTAAARDLAQREIDMGADPGFRVVLIDEDEGPGPGVPPATPTFQLEIPSDTILCGGFAEATPNRGLQEEYLLKSTVRLRAGTHPLPSAEPTFAADLFEEVRFGPEREIAEPQGDGEFRVVIIPGEVATYRFTYAQGFLLQDGRALELAIVSPFQYRARGEEPVEVSGTLGPAFFAVLKGREALQASIDGVPLVRYGSCTYETLDRWAIHARLADGTELALDERFEEASNEFDTGPASLVRAQVNLASEDAVPEERIVTDYFDLVYSAERHNTLVDYRVVFDAPLQVAGVSKPVSAIELRSPYLDERPLAEASYLGEGFEVVGSSDVVEFTRELLPALSFRRGDANADGAVEVIDAIFLLDYVFGRGAVPPCLEAADAANDGRINLRDAVGVVSALFGNHTLPAPFPECGGDATGDPLSCSTYEGCR
jgi:hypothetical protein